MPEVVKFFCYAVAFICFLLAAFAVKVPKVNTIGLGLAAWVLVPAWNAWP
jgi:hypothetical protein